MARRLIREEGLLCGGSSGSAMYCAIQAAKDFGLTAGQRVVVMMPDSVRNYMTKFLNDDWMKERSLLDVDNNLHEKKTWWWNLKLNVLKLITPLTVNCSATIQDTLKLLNEHGVDQVPILNNDGEIQGVVTVSLMMSQLTKGKFKTDMPVIDIAYKQFKKIKPSASLGELSAMLDTDYYVVVVKDKEQGIESVKSKGEVAGIVTRIDLLNFIASSEEDYSNGIIDK